ncbi:MAG: UDP-3-O-acyl-N-acetylglucosamine deacetylase [Rhodospirillales bacterium]|nr:UDP-3-O-acyl-N-acetylglucosamine deacetylase [Rhodospirillales bacterium]MCB9996682.1 UDP-3-O-acyl-N-acetylglucosamine deacetylase [Rhodospirillales bacterium]
MQQQTLAKAIDVNGIGLHSGAQVRLSLKPAPAGHGIVFVRTDVTDRDNVIPALWNKVVDTRLCTVIANEDGVSVGTIEHLMAALRGCGIDNLRIELDGPEVPVMDGSAAPFVEKIDEAGIRMQGKARRVIKILKEITLEQDGKTVRLRPAIGSSFGGRIDFDHPSIGRQDYTIQLLNGNFRHDLADARTFGFAHEVEALRRNGLALGGSLDNAIVLDQDKVLNDEGLRYYDEFIRHKLLDAIGDLYLAGMPILGAYEADKPGHAMNNAILHQLFAQPDCWVMVDLELDDRAGMPFGKGLESAAAISA